MSAAEFADYVEHFQRRVLQDALAEATAAYWTRRAEVFEAARPTAQDARGQASVEDLRAKWHELTEIAQACRVRASVALVESWDTEVANALEVVA